ncbi:MAG: HAD family phosphatase [Rhodocyclaceae bacterium]|nr:HAD family phosphatase [Rhodocyclaceae bacterium]
MNPVSTVVFDLGGVLIDWNPRHLYRRLIPDPRELDRFLAQVCPQSWNERQDAGRPVAEATRERIALYPDQADLIHAYYGRWEEMLSGPIAGTVALLEALHGRGIPLYALSNWSAELFPVARRRFPFLARFRGLVVSGEEGVIKPEPAIFHRLLDRYRLDAPACLFIDDNPANVAAAAGLGFRTHHFRTPELLSGHLAGLGLL